MTTFIWGILARLAHSVKSAMMDRVPLPEILMGATTIMRNHRGEVVDSPTYTASEAKNAFGRILDAVARTGVVTITRHDEPRAVLLSMEEYRALIGARQANLDTLAEEFDAMLARMQAPGARRALQAAFETPADALGRGAAEGAKRERG